MNPNTSTGVLSQVDWPGAKDVDDCWVLACLAAVHAIAPWEYLPSVPDFRAAAGNPDNPTKPDGGTIAQTAKALRTLWPKIGAKITVLDGVVGGWSQVAAALARHATVDVFVLSGALPAEHRYGYAGRHAVAAAITAALKLGNPLAPPHSRWKPITDAQLKTAAVAWPEPGIHAIVFPTVEEAFTTHPLYVAPVDCAPQVKAAHDAGYAEAKVKAGAAVAGI